MELLKSIDWTDVSKALNKNCAFVYCINSISFVVVNPSLFTCIAPLRFSCPNNLRPTCDGRYSVGIAWLELLGAVPPSHLEFEGPVYMSVAPHMNFDVLHGALQAVGKLFVTKTWSC